MHKRSLFALFLLLATGCMPGVPGTPARKKLPPDEQQLPFHLSDPANDSALISLLNTYKPVAIPLLTRWAQTQPGKVVVDLRADESLEPFSQVFIVERANAFSFPVELVWDSRSAGRANYFLQLASEYKEVNITRTGNCFHY